MNRLLALLKKEFIQMRQRPSDASNFADYAGGAAYNIRLCH